MNKNSSKSFQSNGFYHFAITKRDRSNYISMTTSVSNFSARIEGQFVKTNNKNSMWGLNFWHVSNHDESYLHYHRFAISEKCEYALQVFDQNYGWENLRDWQYSPLIVKGGINRLEINVWNKEIHLAVNGKDLFIGHLTYQESGYVGFTVATDRQTKYAEVRFRNFLVKEVR